MADNEDDFKIVVTDLQRDPMLDSDDDDQTESRIEPNSARPIRMLFCTKWRLRESELEIEDEFDSIDANSLPLLIDDSNPLFLAVFWEGFSTDLKPTLSAQLPDGNTLSVFLPPLKPWYIEQVQMNSLRGFVFSGPGEYTFTIRADGDALCKSLQVRAAAPYAIEIGSSGSPRLDSDR